MKKKYRDIIVNNEKYAWAFKHVKSQIGEELLTIWKNKKIIFKKQYLKEYNIDFPLYHPKEYLADFPSGHVLPSDIERIIQRIKE